MLNYLYTAIARLEHWHERITSYQDMDFQKQDTIIYELEQTLRTLRSAVKAAEAEESLKQYETAD